MLLNALNCEVYDSRVRQLRVGVGFDWNLNAGVELSESNVWNESITIEFSKQQWLEFVKWLKIVGDGGRRSDWRVLGPYLKNLIAVRIECDVRGNIEELVVKQTCNEISMSVETCKYLYKLSDLCRCKLLQMELQEPLEFKKRFAAVLARKMNKEYFDRGDKDNWLSEFLNGAREILLSSEFDDDLQNRLLFLDWLINYKYAGTRSFLDEVDGLRE